MAEAVAGLLTSALVNIAKDKLGSAIAQQANLLWNFGSDLQDMMDMLDIISAALEDAERRSVKDKLVQLWLQRLKFAATDISEMLEDYQDTAKLSGVFSYVPNAYNKMAMANRMKSGREKLSKINREFQTFMFTTQAPNTIIVQHYDERETTANFLLEESIKGRDIEKQEIINMLSSSTRDSEILIVPIYGLGGIGKTTLAQLVYKDNQFKEYDHRIWVYVSRYFDLLKIGNSIFSDLPNEGVQQNRDSLQVIYNSLQKLLSGKKVLIILDDLWEEKETELDKLRNLLCMEGTMIDVLVTTRSEDIALKLSTNKTYKLQPLGVGICWEIIKRLSKFERKSNTKKLEQIGLDIANKCGGIPLAAKTLGNMLRSIDDTNGWIEIRDNDVFKELSEDGVLPSLKLSYERMPPQLRLCFSYCAIFSEGHEILEEDLIYQWISLGFIEPSKAKECIKQLLAMSFLQFSKLPRTSGWHQVRYTIHDLVHDLARWALRDQLFIFDAAHVRNIRWKKYFRYSLLRKYDSTVKLANVLSSKMRALCFSDSGVLHMPRNALSFAKCLRTLDFGECSGIMLPDSIGRLKQLRCLIAPRMQNESLPKFITELPKLQYLNISRSPKLSTLPDSIGKLSCLKYLLLSGCPVISKLGDSFGDLKCLVHLDMSDCSGITKLPDSLGNLTSLQHLMLSGCSSIQSIPESLCGISQLQYLNLSSCQCLQRLPEAIGSLVDLQYLSLASCYQIRQLPESLKNLKNLLHLALTSCSRLTKRSLGCLSGLAALEHLNISEIRSVGAEDVLRNLTNLKHLNLSSNGFSAVDFIGSFTNLEYLNLSYNYGLSCLPESIGNLKRLHTLYLRSCHLLKSLPESIRALELKTLALDGCSDQVMDQATSLVHYSRTLPIFKVRADDANGCSNLPQLEGAHHVTELEIRSLENARSLEEANKVKLLEKHNLSKLALNWTVGAVRLVEDIDVLGQLVPPSGLEWITLQGYGSTRFPGWLMDISRHLTNIVYIYLADLPTCSNLPPLGQLPHLKSFSLWKLPRIKKIDVEFCGGKGAFPSLCSFSIHSLESLEEWNTTYSVEDGVEEFMFPVLDRLMIQYCPRLRLIPCPPTFSKCLIHDSQQVISSLEELDKTSHHSSPNRSVTKLDLAIEGDYCQRMMLFHRFPALKKLKILHYCLPSLPESMRQLTSLQSLELMWCKCLTALPEWLGDLSALETLTITNCESIMSLPSCIQQVTKLRTIAIFNAQQELKKWCKSEENKTKLAHINFVFNHVDYWVPIDDIF